MEKHLEPILVGWNELADLPDWKLHRVRAKIDTGARSSCLHVEWMEQISRERVRFKARSGIRKEDEVCEIEAPIIRIGKVRSSNGHYSRRIFVPTTLKLGPWARTIELNLIDRGDMLFPMLIGRSALAGVYQVDPSRSRLHHPRRKKTKVQRG